MKDLSMSVGCRPLIAVLLLSGVVLPDIGTGATVASPGIEDVTLAKVFVSNEEQCRRLCWYRKSCRRFWHRKDYARSSGKDNCVLHVSTAVPVQTYPEWTSEDVSDSSSPAFSNGCSQRPCDNDNICVPSGTSPHFSCLAPPAADCGKPQSSLANGTFVYAGTSTGDTATFVCDADFMWSSGSLFTATCQNNGLWSLSTPDGACERAVFSSPPDPFRVALPVSPATGWRICLQGVYHGPTRMKLDFHTDSAGVSPVVVLQIDSRQQHLGDVNKVLWDMTDSRGVWQMPAGGQLMNTLPVAAGSPFSLGLVLEENRIQVTFVGHDPVYIPIDKSGVTPIPDIYKARSVAYLGDVNIVYANFKAACS